MFAKMWMSLWVVLFALACSFAESEKLGTSNVQNEHGYVAGPLPLLRRRKLGSDLVHFSARAMESSSPAPTPTPNCEPEERALKEACDRVEAAERALVTIRIIVQKEKQRVVKWEEILAVLQHQIRAQENLRSFWINRISQLNASLGGSSTEKERRDIKAHINVASSMKESVEAKIRALRRDKDHVDSALERAKRRLQKLENDKKKAEDDVLRADVDKRDARRAQDECLAQTR